MSTQDELRPATELRRYLLLLKNDTKWRRLIALCGIKFFFEHTLKRKWPIFDVAGHMPRRNCR